MSPIKTANVKFDKSGAPFSADFDDIYFDNTLGCQQSEQVFIKANNIEQTWLNFSASVFVIAETGFGSGLNFFLTLEKFIAFKRRSNSSLKLHFISTEKYPLTMQDMSKTLKLWPQFDDVSEQLLGQYDITENARQTYTFANGDVSLTIHFRDASEAFTAIDVPEQGLVDAFYLDGFAPSRNPEMWSKALFLQLARLAKKGASLGTFTVAGFVRRGLSEVGFKVSKIFYGNDINDAEKTESTQARFVGLRQGKPLTGFKIREKVESSQHATIVGGGLASACAALALANKGINVTLLCKDEQIAQGASSNAIGAVYPILHQDKDSLSLFYQQGFEHSLALFKQLIAQGYQFSHGFDGLIDVSYKDALVQRQQIFSQKGVWPEDLIHGISKQQVNDISGIGVDHPGLYMPRAGWVCPPELVQAIMQAAIATGKVKVKTKRKVLAVKPLANDRWLLTTNKGQKQIQNLIFCTGADSVDVESLAQLPLSVVRGQVSQMQSNDSIKNLKTVLCHKGYLTPKNNGVHCIGATFDKDDNDTRLRDEDNQYNIDMLASCLGDIGNWSMADVTASKARLRCCTPDHLPMVGRVPNIEKHQEYYQHLSKDKNWHYKQSAPLKNGLYVLTGLGARGLCSAPLLAEILAAEICNDDYPVDEEMLFNLSPNRFVIRDLIKNKP
ncbi:bifunctional tRNA (5-methylaminomethyl-2-thiouridine)(34)-methyltransferase MnmD/FAD-dependent 5-carboxymethylaminomethyl-2-thiouridine(34) oxidoreductase MnmC [Thalassotalea sp. ND16A]|uniref:bifunctional tRNA (5-methylaminomethyl-2-thiouridine)(34)-methyltransferase MnmD/FAD-dependent 5-carboxymethylaminomethyl-2-thiouridine(34) oxidoreductase MnmC n=1 Tax=Thalassotalea sp. ND16A TaxID=1535422 RepID=UPI00051A31E2|nr:bifunctional tRNA (5-methylaminomethyl-2-thiouridine)(34)-methyltransferase MnmD/FAD-dependent 5-carboxymethylaminomethyl-2-thiouridine(34) oxidoreductase MnmC [Thalassotalea sp. ND16A]KGJ92403.1 hypothetical protein ND16A_1581 [Thalassotalea sp. ND16A]